MMLLMGGPGNWNGARPGTFSRLKRVRILSVAVGVVLVTVTLTFWIDLAHDGTLRSAPAFISCRVTTVVATATPASTSHDSIVSADI
jgi:hypothetical protein